MQNQYFGDQEQQLKLVRLNNRTRKQANGCLIWIALFFIGLGAPITWLVLWKVGG